MSQKVSEVYAKSLFDLCVESGVTEQIKTELAALKQVLEENADFIKLMSAVNITKTQKKQLLDNAFQNKFHVLTCNFLKVLVDNGRFNQIQHIIADFEKLYNEYMGITSITATTAIELSPELKEKLIQKLCKATGKKVELITKVDASVLGGIKLNYGNTEIDSTVKSRIDSINKQLSSIIA